MWEQVSDRVRVESGPPRKKAVATRELLDNNVTHKKYQVGAPDSFNRIIQLGQVIDYVDWYVPEDQWVWNVYLLDESTGRYWPIENSPFESKDQAMAAAEQLAAETEV